MNIIAFRLTALAAALFVSLGVLAPTTALAADEATYTVTGGLPSDVSVPHEVALCAAACIDAATVTSPYVVPTDGTTAGRFALTSVPNGTYKLVVKYGATGYAAFGYLKSNLRGEYTVTGDYAAATPFIVDGDSEFGSMVIAKPAPTTHTPSAPKKPTARVRYTGGTSYDSGSYVRLRFKATKVQKGTKIVVKAYASCHANKAFGKVKRFKNGRFSLFGRSRGFDRKSYHYIVRITQHGKKAHFIASRPKCAR